MIKTSRSLVQTVILIVVLVLGWRLVLFGISSMADSLLTYEPSFPYYERLLDIFKVPRYIYSWANFDGVHYLRIVDYGYTGTGLIQAFFPLYPVLILLGVMVSSYQFAITIGLTLSLLFFCGGSIVWWWASPHFLRTFPSNNTRFRWASLLILMLFPTSLFFAGLYTESLFLLLSVTSLYLGKKQHFLWAALLAGLASGTKVIGILLIPALLVELWTPFIQDRKLLKSCFASLLFKSGLIVILGSFGLAVYSGYLYIEFKDPLYFFHIQSEFGAGREESLVLYPQTAWRALKIILTARPFDFKYFTYVQEFIVGTLGFLGILASIKIVRPSVWLFSLLAFLLPTLTGSFSSMPRYILVCYALFLGLTYILHRRTWPLIFFLLLSTLLLVFNTMLFIQGYWVA